MVKTMIARAAMVLVAASVPFGAASAFCLQNDSQNWIHIASIEAEDGKKLDFFGDVLPGKVECCKWQDETCNPTMKKGAQLFFQIYALPDASGASPGAWEFKLPAGGRIEVTGDDQKALEVLLYAE